MKFSRSYTVQDRKCDPGYDPGGNVDPDNALHGAELRQDRKNADYSEQADRHKRHEHRHQGFSKSAAGTGKCLSHRVKEKERCHHLHVSYD